MSEISETTEIEDGMTPAARMGKAIVRGAIIGLPTALIGVTFAVWLITDLSLRESVTTSILPGILLGVFGGGFAGMAATMDD